MIGLGYVGLPLAAALVRFGTRLVSMLIPYALRNCAVVSTGAASAGSGRFLVPGATVGFALTTLPGQGSLSCGFPRNRRNQTREPWSAAIRQSVVGEFSSGDLVVYESTMAQVPLGKVRTDPRGGFRTSMQHRLRCWNSPERVNPQETTRANLKT